MKEKLQEYALIAEIIGGIGIIASLIFVGVQINQSADETALNTKALYVNAYQDSVAQIGLSTSMMAENPDLANIVTKINEGSDYSNTTEELQYTVFVYQMFRQGDLAYKQYSSGIIDEKTLNSLLQMPKMASATNAGSKIWKSFSQYIDSEYQEYLENMDIKCPPTWQCIK